MLEIFILLSKYLFIVYLFLFLLSGFCINLSREGLELDELFFATIQRVTIVLFHITAFAILTFNDTETPGSTLAFGCLTLVYMLFAGILLSKVYKTSSPVLYNGIFFLTDIGLVMLTRLDSSLAAKQFMWCLIGLAALLVLPPILNILPRLDHFKALYAGIAIVLLVSTLVFGSTLYGSTNWISIGPIAFQPSEVVKLLFVFFLASALAQKPELKQLIPPAVVSAVIILCLVGQKDLGSALIFAMTFLVVIYISTSSTLLMLGGLIVGFIASFLGYLIFPHVQTRVNVWLDPWSDVSGTGYQIAQSLFAIGSYGLFGSGFTRGYATYIPVVERDFIFSAVCEELGVAFGIGLILIFVMIFLEGARAALYSRSRYLSLLSAGLTALLSFQTFLIIGGDIGLVPLTGVTLPFVSYGGTSITMSFVIIAILQWIYMRNNLYNADKPVEENDAPLPDTETTSRRRRRRAQ
jgi:cell division protein FtsW (lipid II flippase)